LQLFLVWKKDSREWKFIHTRERAVVGWNRKKKAQVTGGPKGEDRLRLINRAVESHQVYSVTCSAEAAQGHSQEMFVSVSYPFSWPRGRFFNCDFSPHGTNSKVAPG